MLVPKYSIISFLDNLNFSLIEIKSSLNSYQTTNEINYWLLYDKNNDMLLPLELVSQEDKTKSIVYFADSKLVFQDQKGIYSYNTSELIFNIIDNTEPVYKKIKDVLDDYILLLSFKR